MNTEIKFRAYDEDKMLTMPINTNYGISRFFGILSEDVILMQYTVFKDKNGKEIYDGDILKKNHSIYEVLFRDGGWQLTNINDYYKEAFYYLYLFNFLKTEIIGNIYENSELIKTP
jgi:hypothetical protein